MAGHETTSGEFQGQVISAEKLTDEILKVTLELDRPLKYRAGQYARIRLPGISGYRDYSFMDAPMPNGRQQLSFLVQKVSGGEFTSQLFKGELGDKTLPIEAPLGDFYLRESDRPILCVAGGSGLAPFLSMLTDAANKAIERSCTLLFGVRTQHDLYCLEGVEKIRNQWQGQFEFLPALSEEREESDWPGARGRITDFINENYLNIDLGSAEAYLCGPPGMIDAGYEMLNRKGINRRNIFYEKFTDEGGNG